MLLLCDLLDTSAADLARALFDIGSFTFIPEIFNLSLMHKRLGHCIVNLL